MLCVLQSRQSNRVLLSKAEGQLSFTLSRILGGDYFAVGELRLDARKPGAEIVDVSHGDVQRLWDLDHDAFGRPCDHYGFDIPGFPAFDEEVGGVAHVGRELRRHVG